MVKSRRSKILLPITTKITLEPHKLDHLLILDMRLQLMENLSMARTFDHRKTLDTSTTSPPQMRSWSLLRITHLKVYRYQLLWDWTTPERFTLMQIVFLILNQIALYPNWPMTYYVKLALSSLVQRLFRGLLRFFLNCLWLSPLKLDIMHQVRCTVMLCGLSIRIESKFFLAIIEIRSSSMSNYWTLTWLVY
jgi:hypothetical protein